jgi:hypothetical protein
MAVLPAAAKVQLNFDCLFNFIIAPCGSSSVGHHPAGCSDCQQVCSSYLLHVSAGVKQDTTIMVDTGVFQPLVPSRLYLMGFSATSTEYLTLRHLGCYSQPSPTKYSGHQASSRQPLCVVGITRQPATLPHLSPTPCSVLVTYVYCRPGGTTEASASSHIHLPTVLDHSTRWAESATLH